MRRRSWSGTLLLGFLALASAEPTPRLPRDTLPARLSLETIPAGLDKRPATPADNPLDEAKVQLGRALFFDPILSGDGTLSCATCHDPAHGFASPDPQAIGIRGRRGRRNAPTLLNRAYATSLFWDGREGTLEGQALKPILCAQEMGSTVPETVKRLETHAEYPGRFRKVFADGVTGDNLAKALASFERTLLSGNSRIDRFRHGEVGGMTAAERQGLWLFESRGGCWRCHSGPNLTDEAFHNTGVSWGRTPLDLGRFEVTGVDADRGRFKTPTLRDVARTAPYMHDGSLATLEDVVEFYNRGGNPNPHLDPIVQPLRLSQDDAKSLVAFLKALSGTAEEGKPR